VTSKTAQPAWGRWGYRYDAQGIKGPPDVPRSRRPPALSAEQTQELDELVLAGPDPKKDGVVRWRYVDLRGQIKARFEMEVHERTAGKPGEALASLMLRRLRMTRLRSQPCHPRQDPAAQEAFRKASPP